MSPGYGMLQQQAMKLRMTPKLRQALKILQMSTPELMDCIQQELQENPVLECASLDWEGYRRPIGTAAATATATASNNDYDPLANAPSNDLSLEKFLTEQLHFTKNLTLPTRKIIRYMIGNLDLNGYLAIAPGDIALSLRIPTHQVDEALSILQDFEPAGIAARDLSECLDIQVRRLPEGADIPLIRMLINGHLEDVADGNIRKLARILQAAPQQIESAIETIKSLNPRPGAAFHPGEVQYIIPDVAIEQEEKRLIVHVQEAAAPRLSVNSQYRRMLSDSDAQTEAIIFLHEKMQSAKFLIKCMEQRRFTLQRVTQAIVEEQADYMRKGAAYLKPLTLRQIADKINLHESTVSRAIAGKYMQTPWGVHEYKFFFPGGVSTDTGETASSIRVKSMIKHYITQEERGKPFSDQQLSKVLAEKEGIRISRRTLAKYREELGIPSSARRRRTHHG